MYRVNVFSPKLEYGSSKTYSFFTGINFYTGLGIIGIIISIFGFGIVFERINS